VRRLYAARLPGVGDKPAAEEGSRRDPMWGSNASPTASTQAPDAPQSLLGGLASPGGEGVADEGVMAGR